MAIVSRSLVRVLGTLIGPGKGILRRRFVHSVAKSASSLLSLLEIVRYIAEIVFQYVMILGHLKENSEIDQEKEILLASGNLIIVTRQKVRDLTKREVHFSKDEKNVPRSIISIDKPQNRGILNIVKV